MNPVVIDASAGVDATYVALAEQMGAPLLTDDHRLASAPTLPVPVLQLAVH